VPPYTSAAWLRKVLPRLSAETQSLNYNPDDDIGYAINIYHSVIS